MPRNTTGSALDHLAFASLDSELLLAVIGLDHADLGLARETPTSKHRRCPAEVIRLYRRL